MDEVIPKHSIKVVAQRTGLSPHVIRVWERRYATVQPQRSQGNQRLYGEDDIQRLLLLRQVTEAGHPIRTVAQLPEPKLREMVAKMDLPTELRATAFPRRPAVRTGAELIEIAFAAVRNMDAAELERTLEEGAVSLGQVALLSQVVAPLVERIGEAWEEGSVKVAHEHLASAVIRTYLSNASRPIALHPAAPSLISTTPSGQLHEIGAALAAAVATSHGWRVTYLGPSLPAEEIVGVARHQHAQAVALSLVHPSDDPQLDAELKRLRRLLPEDTALLVGGRAAHAYRETLTAVSAIVCDSLDDFSSALDRLRQGSN